MLVFCLTCIQKVPTSILSKDANYPDVLSFPQQLHRMPGQYLEADNPFFPIFYNYSRNKAFRLSTGVLFNPPFGNTGC